MAKINNEHEYNVVMERIEALAPLFDDSTPLTDPKVIEYTLLSNLVEEYEEEHYPISKPSLANVMRLRMAEMGLTQASLSSLLGISPSRVSDYLTGKCDPTLKVGRLISQKLDISPSIILGV